MAKNRNIKYKSVQLLDYYRKKRKSWRDLYPSEKAVFKKISGAGKPLGEVLDVGCACGGLGKALRGRFRLDSYTGVDIHAKLIKFAEDNVDPGLDCDFICGDILDLELTKEFDTVVSLSCADWNIETEKMVRVLWGRVKRGGNLLISLRLAENEGINDIRKSFQYIDPKGNGAKNEVANYAVFNLKDALDMFRSLRPKPGLIGAYGYWGRPSPTAVTCYDKLVFAVFYINKGSAGECRMKLNLPGDFHNYGQKIS